MRNRSLLPLALLLALSLHVPQVIGNQAEHPVPQRFSIELVKGTCRECRITFALGRIQFVSPQEGWAVGEHLSATGNGSGVSTILHTTDGGRTWRRLPSVWQHGAEAGPPFWFVDRRNGWVSWIDESAVHHLSQTTNGGQSWQSLANPPAQAFAALQFLDAENGISIGTRLDEKPLFGTTSDGGSTWRTTELPMQYAAGAWFMDRKVGWVAGIISAGKDERRLALQRTVDGGVHWTASLFPEMPYESVRDCDWTDPAKGWLIVWLANGDGSHLLRTTDGGITWERNQDKSFQGKGKYLKAIRFVSTQTGYAFFDDTETGGHYVLSTIDGGRTWERTLLKESVSSCQVVSTEVWCSAGINLLKLRTATNLPSGTSH